MSLDARPGDMLKTWHIDRLPTAPSHASWTDRMNSRNDPLSRRERQIMDVIYRLGKATAADVHREIPHAPSRTAVRTLLNILEAKGHLTHTLDGITFVYAPSRPREQAARSAFRGLLETFFEGSLEKAVATHLADDAAKLTPEELDRLSELIRKARKKGK